MDVIKGSTFKISGIAYAYWTGEVATSVKANLAGATIKEYVKKRDTDSDAAALLTINGTVIDAPNGLYEIPFAAVDTNTLPYSKLFRETVVKLADGTYIRNGVQPLNLKPNVGKTLF